MHEIKKKKKKMEERNMPFIYTPLSYVNNLYQRPLAPLNEEITANHLGC